MGCGDLNINMAFPNTGLPAGGGVSDYLGHNGAGVVGWYAFPASLPPSGPAGGDLSGTYPNPILVNTAVVPSTYGSATQVSRVTVDSKGRLTAVTNVTITGVTPGGSAGGDLTGTYPNPTLVTTAVVAGTYGSATQVAQFTVDSKGRLTSAGGVTITGVTPGGTAGGDLSGTYPDPIVAQIQGFTVTSTDPTDNQILVYDGGAAEYVLRNQMSYVSSIDPYHGSISNTNWSTPVAASVVGTSKAIMESNGAVGAKRKWMFEAVPGTNYTIDLLVYVGNSQGIYTVKIDGTTVGTLDAYSASAVPDTTLSLTGKTIAAAGTYGNVHDIELEMATKNVASAAFYGDLEWIYIYQP